MKKIFGLLVLTVLYTSCSAQLQRVQKIQAFFTVSTPGTQFVDESGNRVPPVPIIERFIYLECKYNGRPVIDSVWYNGILFTASVADKEEEVLSVGTRKNNGKTVMLNPKKGNHIWRIDLFQADGKTLQHGSLKKILVKGKLDRTKFNYTFTTETELSAPDRY